MLSQLKKIKDFNGNLSNKKILLRADLNAPIKNGKITDDFRIKNIFPLLDFLLENKAKIIILSHLSNIEGTLLPVFEYLKTKYQISFAKNLNDSKLFNPEQIVLLENIRQFPEEIQNDQIFAKQLSNLAEIYINEAFSASHHKHASIVSIPKFLPSFIGPLFEKEIKELSKILNPEKPFIAILGGKKAKTKIPLIEKLMNLTDKIFIGGALSNNFLLASGKSIGQSIFSKEIIIPTQWLTNPKLIFPKKYILKNLKGDTRLGSDIMDDEIIVDTDLSFVNEIKQSLSKAKTIFWNGPLGICEDGFEDGTKALAINIANSTGFSIIGGGNSVSTIHKFNLEDKFDFVSTGGGATLKFITTGSLDGIEALLNYQKHFN